MPSNLADLLPQMKDLYIEKNTYLEQFFEKVAPYDFYRFIFPSGSFERRGRQDDRKPNAIAVSIDSSIGKVNGIALGIEGGGRTKRYTVTDELQELENLYDTAFTIMSPISYYGKQRLGKNARFLYAMVFDLDGVGMPQLRDVIHQMNHNILPKATFIVNSGTGLHLYYVLTDPVPMYPQNQKYLRQMKYFLTRQIWNRFTSTLKEPQMQGVLQGFRVVGSCSKLGKDYPVVAFSFGDRITLQELMEFIPDTNGERQQVQGIMMKSKLSLDEAKEKYPEWYEHRIVRGESRNRWVVKRDLYDWWLNRIRTEIKVGHRFYGIMTLAIYAKKCCISAKELNQDAYSLLKIYDEMSVEELNRFTEDDIRCALEMYNEDYVTFPRDDIAKLSGLSMPINKRNRRTQEDHLKRCRIIQLANDEVDGTNWRSGNGRKSKRDTVMQYLLAHPDVKNKSVIARELNISRPTVIKYYDEIVAELNKKEI